ncbi:hypothetical protein ACFL2A_00770 [Thermodesulfobacteriota bacterium]
MLLKKRYIFIFGLMLVVIFTARHMKATKAEKEHETLLKIELYKQSLDMENSATENVRLATTISYSCAEIGQYENAKKYALEALKYLEEQEKNKRKQYNKYIIGKDNPETFEEYMRIRESVLQSLSHTKPLKIRKGDMLKKIRRYEKFIAEKAGHLTQN